MSRWASSASSSAGSPVLEVEVGGPAGQVSARTAWPSSSVCSRIGTRVLIGGAPLPGCRPAYPRRSRKRWASSRYARSPVWRCGAISASSISGCPHVPHAEDDHEVVGHLAGTACRRSLAGWATAASIRWPRQELVVPGEVRPALAARDLIRGVEIAVHVLGGLEQDRRLVRHACSSGSGARASSEPTASSHLCRSSPGRRGPCRRLRSAPRQRAGCRSRRLLQAPLAVGDQHLTVEAPALGPQATVDARCDRVTLIAATSNRRAVRRPWRHTLRPRVARASRGCGRTPAPARRRSTPCSTAS